MVDSNLPLVSIVVACYNKLEITLSCLSSLYQQDYPVLEIILVDSGSREDVSSIVMKEFPKTRLIRLEENHGFTGGYNRGMENAQGKYIAIINNDAIASPGWISSMVNAMEQDEMVGAVASVIIDGNQPEVMDSFGVKVALDGMSRQSMKGLPPPYFTEIQEVVMPSGCACLLRKEALEKIGLFDEMFFAYCEDTDLFLRIRWIGYKIVIVPGAVVNHYYSLTVGKYSLQKIFLVERNHYWVAAKNFPLVLLVVLPWVTLWRFIVQAYLVIFHIGDLHLFKEEAGTLEVLKTLFQAQCAAIAGFPKVMQSRMALKQKRKISSWHMIQFLCKNRMGIRQILL